MTIYQLTSGKVVETPQDIARYFSMDVDYLINVSEDMGFQTENTRKRREEAKRCISEDRPEDMSEDCGELVAAIFVGDAEWNEPIQSWFSFPYNSAAKLMDPAIHHKWIQIARKYGKMEKLCMPRYSVPSDFEGDYDPSVRKGVLVYSILDLEWYYYVAKHTDIEIDPELVDKTREETFQFFTGKRKRLSPEVERFQKSLLTNASVWIDDLMEEYDISSYTLRSMSQGIRDAAENEL